MKQFLALAWVLVVLTKFVSVPIRLGGSSLCVFGAFFSIVPVVGNLADEGLRQADDAIAEFADTVDDVPI
jgi:hypothetical protein